MKPVSHNTGDPLMKTIIKYRFHPSIIAIKEYCTRVYLLVSLWLNVMKSWKKLIILRQTKPHKAQTYPQNLLREILFLQILFLEIIITAFPFSIFPNSLKNAMTTQVHKKCAKTSEDNYRPASILSNISKYMKE